LIIAHFHAAISFFAARHVAVSLLFDRDSKEQFDLWNLFRIFQNMPTDLPPEILVILETRKLIDQSLQAAFSRANAFSRVCVATDWPSPLFSKYDGPTVFLIVSRSYLQTHQTIQQVQSAQPEATIVILDEQFRYGGGLLTRDVLIHGYWTFHDSTEEILRGIVRASRRCPSISPHATGHLRHSRRKGVQIGPNLLAHPFYNLSKRERQLFFLIAAGKKNEACAAEMSIAQKTVCNLREKLMKKFNVQSGADLVWKALEIGLVNS